MATRPQLDAQSVLLMYAVMLQHQHSEFLFKPNVTDHFFYAGDGETLVRNDALIFSLGLTLNELVSVEVIVSFADSPLIGVTAASQVLGIDPDQADTASTQFLQPNLYASVIRKYLGLDRLNLSVNNYSLDVEGGVIFPQSSAGNNYEWFVDPTFSKMASVIESSYSFDNNLLPDISAAGLFCVAVRPVINKKPQSVIWLNGNFTPDATEQAAQDIVTVTNAAKVIVRKHYTEQILKQISAYCPSLMP